MKESNILWIYMLKLENGHYYTGYTTNLVRRYQQHVNGKAGKYTRSFKPKSIAQCWQLFDTVGTALKVERFIKNKDRKFKNFIVENPQQLKSIIGDKLDVNAKLVPFDPTRVEI